MRTTTIFVLGLLALACGGSGGASDDETIGTTSGDVGGSSSSTGGPACTPGSEGCACNEGACEGGLACFSQICVMPPGLESSSSGSVDTSTSGTGNESSGATTESSGSGDETAAESGSDSESSSTAAPPEACEEENNHVCQDGVLGTCMDGELLTESCADLCAQTGYLSPGCADVNGCDCDGYADATCVTIMGKFCSCYALFGNPCDEAFEHSIYNYCFDPTIDENSHDIVVCYGDFPTDTLDECYAAADACT